MRKAQGSQALVMLLLTGLLLAACGGATTQGGSQAVTPTPASFPKLGHAPDYSWVAGQVVVTRIQGGCTFVKTDSESFSPNGEGWQGDRFKNGDYVVIFGHIAREGEPRVVCPGGTPYIVDKATPNPAGGS